jgi:hypothetical protein
MKSSLLKQRKRKNVIPKGTTNLGPKTFGSDSTQSLKSLRNLAVIFLRIYLK